MRVFFDRRQRRQAPAREFHNAIGCPWPVVRRPAVDLTRVDPLLGRYNFDASTQITAEAHKAGYWSAPTAIIRSVRQTLRFAPRRSARGLPVFWAPLARDIAGAGWPVLVVMEGGYALNALGANVASF